MQGVSKEDLYLGPAVEDLMVLQGIKTNVRKYSCRSHKFCLILEQQPANCGLARVFVNKERCFTGMCPLLCAMASFECLQAELSVCHRDLKSQ